jgi:hypothetical protein
MKKEAYEQWCAFLILQNSDQAKYGEVLHDLASQYSLDNDQYPRKTTKAVDCLSNHRHDNAGKPGKNGHGKDQDQASRSGSGNDTSHNSGNGNGTETSFAQQSNKHADRLAWEQSSCDLRTNLESDNVRAYVRMSSIREWTHTSHA